MYSVTPFTCPLTTAASFPPKEADCRACPAISVGRRTEPREIKACQHTHEKRLQTMSALMGMSACIHRCAGMHEKTFINGLKGRNVTTSRSMYIPPMSRNACTYAILVCVFLCVFVYMRTRDRCRMYTPIRL